MAKPVPKIVPYPFSRTYNFCITGLRLHGKRHRKFYKTKREAEVALQQIRIKIENEGTKALNLPDEVRHMAAHCGSQRVILSFAPSKVECPLKTTFIRLANNFIKSCFQTTSELNFPPFFKFLIQELV